MGGGSRQGWKQLAEATAVQMRWLRREVQHSTGLALHIGKQGKQSGHCRRWLLLLLLLLLM